MDITYVCIIIGRTEKKKKLNVPSAEGTHTEQKL